MSGDNVIVGVGDNIWYSPGVLNLLASGFPLQDYLTRHAMGDPGESAVLENEVMAHSVFISEDGLPVTSAFYDADFDVYICFVTTEERDQSYCFSIHGKSRT